MQKDFTEKTDVLICITCWGQGESKVLPLKQCWTLLFCLRLCSWHLKNCSEKNTYKRKHGASFFMLQLQGRWLSVQMQTKSTGCSPGIGKSPAFQRQYCLTRRKHYWHHKQNKHNFWKYPLILFVFYIPLLTWKYERVSHVSSQKMQDRVGSFNGLMVFSMGDREQMNSDVISTAVQSKSEFCPFLTHLFIAFQELWHWAVSTDWSACESAGARNFPNSATGLMQIWPCSSIESLASF